MISSMDGNGSRGVGVACLAAWLAVLVLAWSGAARAWMMPDTGQTKCYDPSGNEMACPSPGQNYYGQDANYNASQPHFELYDNVIRDLNTGLMWERTGSGGSMQFAPAETRCNDLELDGHTDWRLPTHTEMLSIVNYGASSPAAFSGFTAKNSGYWTSYVFPGTNSCFIVKFDTGHVCKFGKSNNYYCRCVRSD